MRGDIMKALVTGASSGIGYEISKYLSKKGYDIIAVARSKEALENLRQMRASAADLPELTLDDINEEIRLTREQRGANRK